MRRLLLIFALFVGSISAATYTIGPSATYANWAALVVAHGTLSAGDIIEYQAAAPGGSSTITGDYINANAVSGNGTAGNVITIRVRSGDTITLDGNQSVANAVYLNKDYWTIDGFKMINYTNVSLSGVVIVTNSANATIQNCDIHISLVASAATDKRGIAAYTNVSDVLIYHNTISNDAGSWASAGDVDGMLIAATRAIIRNNTITISNGATSSIPHDDGIQGTDNTDITVERNIINMTANTGTPCQGIFLENYNSAAGNVNYGTFNVRNNVVVAPGGSYVGNFALRLSGPATTIPIVAYVLENNVFDNLASGLDTVKFTTDTGTWVGGSALVKNNIFINRATQTGARLCLGFYAQWSGSITADYNHYYAPAFAAGDNIIGIGGTSYTFTTWQAASFDAHGVGYNGGSGNPNFTNPASIDYTLQSSSPDKGAGVDLSGTFTTDLLGLTRSAPWDIGAYKYVASDTTPPTPSPSTIASAVSLGTSSIRVSATTATDAGSPPVLYRFSKDGGSTWTAYQSGTSYDFTGLTASTLYHTQVQAEDSAASPNVTTASANTDVTTDAAGNGGSKTIGKATLIGSSIVK